MTEISMDALETLANEEQQRNLEKMDLSRVKALGEQLKELDARIDEMGLQLERLSKQRQLVDTELTRGLTDLGLKGIKLKDGSKIELAEVITATISDDNREAALAWLRAHNYDDLIKNQVVVTFGRGEDKDAIAVKKGLLEARAAGELKFGDVVQNETVLWQTLRAFVKERLASGQAFPLETFKVYIGAKAKLVKPKRAL